MPTAPIATPSRSIGTTATERITVTTAAQSILGVGNSVRDAHD